MQLRMAIVGAALAAGCGDATDGAASPEYVSGARLRAQDFTVERVVSRIEGIYRELLGMD